MGGGGGGGGRAYSFEKDNEQYKGKVVLGGRVSGVVVTRDNRMLLLWHHLCKPLQQMRCVLANICT